jgi:radical SAM protein with 4Fe4S-binding SPASM domain
MSLNTEQKLRNFAYNIKTRDCASLITLQIDLTDFCVCKCQGCEHWKWPVKTKLSYDILENNVFPYLKDFDTLQSIVFSGGEPLLHPEVETIIERIRRDFNLDIGIITSGLGKNDINWKLLSQNCNWIRFSSDGFTKKNYYATRGVDLFDKWSDNLKTLLQENKNTNCKTRINVTIHEYNINTFADGLFDALYDLNVEIHFWLSRELIDKIRKHVVDKEEIIISTKLIEIERSGLSINIDNVFRHVDHIRNDFKYTSCFIPKIFGLIAADGNVFPCCYMYEPVFTIDKQQKAFIIGNINEQSLKEIYESKRFFDISNEFLSCNKEYAQCKFCDRFDHINKYLNDYNINFHESIFI